jgi:hypothetical protein
MDAKTEIAVKAQLVAEQFKQKWGVWRRFISANPLTGTWITLALGVAAGAGMGREAIQFVLSLVP